MIGPRLKDLGRWYSGGTPPSEQLEYWDGDIPWLSGKDFDRTRLREPSKHITVRGLPHSRLMPAGDSIIVLVRGMALAHGLPVARLTRDAAINQDVRGLVVSTSFDPDFTYYVLRGRRAELDIHIDRAAHGTARVRDTLYAHRIGWLPHLDVQRAIARFLDRACERIDTAITTAALLAPLAEERLERELATALFGEADGDRWFGGVDGEWRVRPLRTMARGNPPVFTDGDWIEAPYITDDGIRLIQTGNIGLGEFVEQGFRYISQKTFSALQCTEVLKGDVLFSRLNPPVGRACICPDLRTRMVASVDVAILRPDLSAIVPEWLVAMCSSERYLRWLDLESRGTTMQRVSRSQLGAVLIPTPPLEHQHRVAEVWGSIQRSRTRHRNSLNKVTAGLKEYRDSLIHEAVTGKLDVTKTSEQQMEERLHAASEGRLDEVTI